VFLGVRGCGVFFGRVILKSNGVVGGRGIHRYFQWEGL